jgi:hypothetical protein
VNDPEGALPPVLPETSLAISTHLERAFAESPETVLSDRRGTLPRHAFIAGRLRHFSPQTVASCLGQTGGVWLSRRERLFAVLGFGPIVFRASGPSRSVLRPGSDFWTLVAAVPPGECRGEPFWGTFLFCDDGWFAVHKTPDHKFRWAAVDFRAVLAACRDLIQNGERSIAVVVRGALLGFYSLYMKGAPESWGPLLDEVVSTVAAIEGLLVSSRTPK